MENQVNLQYVLEVEQFIRAQAVESATELHWRRTDDPDSRPVHTLYHGGAGIVIFYLELHRATQKQDYLNIAIKAGVGYFFADLYRLTFEPRYLDAAVRAAGYVKSRATQVCEDGHLVCHNEEESPASLFYLGVCHGPAGTGRLFYLLYQITGEDQYLHWLEANIRGLLSTGAPEKRSSGLWNNAGQCCGDAGIGDYALFLYEHLHDPSHLDLAERVARELIRRSHLQEGRRSWPAAEHRTREDFIEAQTGYMQGAAGIGSFLLHLATSKSDIEAKIHLPDHPF